MEYEIWVVVFLSAAYFLAGFIDSVAGGGGLIGVPAFLLAGIPAEFALGTNKMVGSTGTLTSLGIYARSGNVLWKLAVVGVPAALLGSFIGTETILLFDAAFIEKLIIFLLPIAIVVTLMPKKNTVEDAELSSKKLYTVGGLVCFCLGFYDGFFGPGTGSFFIISFNFFLGMSLLKASATAKIFNLATNVGSLIAFIINGKVLFLLAIPLATCNILGNIIGSKMAIRIGASFVRKVLIVSLTILLSTLIIELFI